MYSFFVLLFLSCCFIMSLVLERGDASVDAFPQNCDQFWNSSWNLNSAFTSATRPDAARAGASGLKTYGKVENIRKIWTRNNESGRNKSFSPQNCPRARGRPPAELYGKGWNVRMILKMWFGECVKGHDGKGKVQTSRKNVQTGRIEMKE